MHTRMRIMVTIFVMASLTGAAAAQPTSFSYRQSGNLVGAQAGGSGPNQSWGVNLNPVIGADGRDSYLVSWTAQTWTDIQPTPSVPYPKGSWFATVIGIAPASEIRVSPSGNLAIDLSTAKLSEVQVAIVADCTYVTAPCASGDVSSFIVKGTFTPCQPGYACSTFSRNGTDEQCSVNPPFNIITTTFTGSQTGGDADFTGTIGPLTILPGTATFRNMTVRKGLFRFDQVPLK